MTTKEQYEKETGKQWQEFNGYEQSLSLNKYIEWLEKKVEEGEKAKEFIDLLLAEFQDGMDEKLFYEMTNKYIKDYQSKKEETKWLMKIKRKKRGS